MAVFTEALVDHRSAVHVVSVRMRNEEMTWVSDTAAKYKVAKGEVIRQVLRQARLAGQKGRGNE